MKTKTKSSIVKNGQIEFGTFSEPIQNVNLLDAKISKFPIPRFIRNLRLKEFQAYMGGDDDYFFLAFLFSNKNSALAQIRVYDIKNGKHFVYQKKLLPFRIKTPNNIINSTNFFETDAMSIRFDNKLVDNYIGVKIKSEPVNNKPALEIDVKGDYLNFEHQVVSIPFSDNTGMYSHKGITRMKGSITIGDTKHIFNPECSFFSTDDHKGYYPYRMEWEWISSAFFKGNTLFGLTLTQNQSIDSDMYNENAIWINSKRYSLPAVTFLREHDKLFVSDKTGDIQLEFETKLMHKLKFNVFPLFKINYRGPFGRLNGKIILSDKTEIVFNNSFAFAEHQIIRC